MIKRVFLEDIATLALLYHYEATTSSSSMLPISIIQEYAKVIDVNLDKINSTINRIYPLDYNKLIYTNTQDENGIWYAVLKYDLNIEGISYDILSNTTEDLKIASQMSNALEVLGIQMIDGKMIKKEHENHLSPVFPKAEGKGISNIKSWSVSQNELEKNASIVLDKIIERVVENPQEFYEKIASVLTPQEKEFVKMQIQNKSCLNCTNPSCHVESYEKTMDTCCVAWENQELVGQQLLLIK